MKTLWIVLAVLALLAIPLLSLMFYGMGEIRRLVIAEVDLGKLADGAYTGSYHKGRWTYDVEVTIESHRITAVKNLNKRMETLKDWNEKAEAAMLNKQAINIDVVSGATITTKAFEKAVERALTSSAHTRRDRVAGSSVDQGD